MLALSIVLLLIAFRSLLIPVQAVVTNLLCVGAAFGLLVATFQWGWGLGLVGLDTSYGTVPIASYVPLMMFAALFGLSMDYEVFLVSQIAQHHAAGEPSRQAGPLRPRLQRQGDRGGGHHHDLGLRQPSSSTATPRSNSSGSACRSRSCSPRHGPVPGPGPAGPVRGRGLVARAGCPGSCPTSTSRASCEPPSPGRTQTSSTRLTLPSASCVPKWP